MNGFLFSKPNLFKFFQGLDVRDKGVCASKDCVYLVGGRSNVGRAVWKFDTLTNEWESLPDMTTSRRSPGVLLNYSI